MKTREQLRAEYERELRTLEIEESLRERLSIAPRMVHVHDLYGESGSITYGDSFDRSDDDKVSLERLVELLTALPPVPVVHAKGTFTRFITQSFAESDGNKDRERETREPIFPITLKTNSVCGFSLKAEWFTEIDGQIWSVDAFLAQPSSLARVNARLVEYKGGRRYENSRLSIDPVMGYGWREIRWGRGSDEYPNDFTAYRQDPESDPVEWVREVLTNVNAKREAIAV